MKIVRSLLLAVLLFVCIAGISAQTVSGLVSLDAAMAGAAADLASRVSGTTEIAIAGIDTTLDGVADFLTDELSVHLHLMAGGTFILLDRSAAALAALDDEHQFQMSGLVSDASAVGIGHYLGAKVVVTGSFTRFAAFSQLRLRAIDVRSSRLLTIYSARIRPNDAVLAAVMSPALVATPAPAVAENALTYLNRGEDLLREGRYDEAIRELDRALAIDRNLVNAYFYRGYAYSAKGDIDRAIDDYSAALRIKPNYYEALNNRGRAYYYGKGDPDRAIADFTASLRIKSDDFEVLNNRGIAYHDKRDYDHAIADYTAALRIKGDDYVTLYNRGVACHNKGDYDRAIEDYDAALRILPDGYLALNNRGIAYYNKGDYNRAIADWEAVLRIDPNDADTRDLIEIARQMRGY